jgi:hypothetical protein
MAAGSIIIDLLLKTGAFESDTERARKTLEKKMAEMKKSAVEAGKVIGQAMAGFTTAVTVLVTQTARASEEMRRFAQLSGTSTQTFQTMAAGAKMAGIEQDKLADIFKDVQDKVGDFMQTGGGPLADFFEQIAPKVGVTADEFRRLSGPDALQLYVSSLEKANLSQSDMIFYMEAIASDASLLLPLLQDGGKGFAEFGEMARQFGVILSDEAVVAMQDFKRSQDVMSLATKGFANQLTVALVPAFQNVVKMFSNTETGAKNLTAAVQIAANAMKILMSAGAFVAGIFKTVGEALGGLAAIVVDVFAGRFNAAFETAKNASWDFVDNVKMAVRAAGAVWDEYTPTPGLLPAPAVGGGRLSTAPMGGKASGAAAAAAKKEADDATAAWLKMMDDYAQMHAAKVQINRAALDDIKKQEQDYDDWMRGMQMAEHDRYYDMLAQREDATKKTQDLAKDLGMTFTSAFEDAIAGGKSLGEVLRGLEQDIIRLITRKLVTEPLGNMFTSWLGSVIPGFGGARATGGDVIGGRAYLVGENGPEMFVPRTTGTVVPNSSNQQTQRAGNVINVNVTAVQGMTRDTALQQGQRIAQGLQLAMMRNG